MNQSRSLVVAFAAVLAALLLLGEALKSLTFDIELLLAFIGLVLGVLSVFTHQRILRHNQRLRALLGIESPQQEQLVSFFVVLIALFFIFYGLVSLAEVF